MPRPGLAGILLAVAVAYAAGQDIPTCTRDQGIALVDGELKCVPVDCSLMYSGQRDFYDPTVRMGPQRASRHT